MINISPISPVLTNYDKYNKVKVNSNSNQKNQIQPGLCTTCSLADFCHYNEHIYPVIQCEEFEGYPLEKNEDNKAKISAPSNLRSKTYLIGLCKSCDKSNFCNFPKPESGIWQCEEFE